MVRRALIAWLVVVAVAAGWCPVQGADVPADTPALSAEQRATLPYDELQPALAAPAPAGDGPALSDRAAEQLASARQLVQAQRYAEAVAALERALRYQPQHPKLEAALAAVHLESGNGAQARRLAQQSVERNAASALPHLVLGQLAARDGAPEEALRELRLALRCPDVSEYPYIAALGTDELAALLAEAGYLQAAQQQYGRFVERAEALLDAGGLGATRRALLAVRQRSARSSRAALLAQLGRPAEAARVLEPVLAEEPVEPALRLRYAGLLLRAGDPDRALIALREAAEPSDEWATLLRETLDALGMSERWLAELQARADADPDEPGWVQRLAKALTDSGEPAQAARGLERYLARHPEASAVRRQLVDLYAELGQWPALLDACAGGVARDARADDWLAPVRRMAHEAPNLMDILEPTCAVETAANGFVRGVLAEAADRPDLAERWWQRSLATEPSFVPSRVALGSLYLDQHRWDQALATASLPLTTDEPAEDAEAPAALPAALAVLRGRVHLALDQLELAEEYFKAAVQADPDSAAARFELARCLRESGQPNLAQQQLQLLVGLDLDHVAGREALIELLLQQRRLEAAVAQLEQLRNLSGHPLASARAAALLDLFGHENPEQYRADLRAAMEARGEDAATWRAIAESYTVTPTGSERDIHAQTPARRAAWQAALALDPRDEVAAIGLVGADEDWLAFDAAADRLRALLETRPNHHIWRLRLINDLLNADAGDVAIELARDYAGRAELSEEDRDRYRIALAHALELAGRDEQRLALLREWASAEEEPGPWTYRLAAALLEADRPGDVVALLAPANGERDRSDRGQALLRTALIAAGRSTEAVQLALDNLYDDPLQDDAVARVIHVMFEADDVDGARALLANARWPEARRQTFELLAVEELSAADLHDECIELLNRLISDQSTLAQPVLDLDTLQAVLIEQLIRAEDFSEAERQLEHWRQTRSTPATRRLYYQLRAVADQAQGRPDLATQSLERALLLDPDNVGLNNDVAYNWIDQGHQLELAEGMIRYALSRAPREPAYLDTFGWLRYKQGDWEAAYRWLTRAARLLDEPDPVILDHLGDTCYRLGRLDEATRHWSQAAQLIEPRPADARTPDEVRAARELPLKLEAVEQGKPASVAPADPAADGAAAGDNADEQ